jgi:hypothetical protein
MRLWQKDALKLFREARAHATKTSDLALHRACARAIEAMIAEGGCVPSDLRLYAQQMPRLEMSLHVSDNRQEGQDRARQLQQSGQA